MKKLFFLLVLFSQLYSQIEYEKKEYKVSVTNTWPPFNFLDDKSKLNGISIDYWNLIKKKANIKSKNYQEKNFSNVLKKIKNKNYDITINTTYTQERAKYSVFSKPYEKFPIAIVTKTKEDFISKTSLLNGKKIAVGKNYSAYYLLKEKYKNIDFVLVKNTKEALKLVKNGDVFAATDILPSLHYYLFELEDKSLKINGITDVNFNLQIMLNKDLEYLLPSINKAIDEISLDERSIIYAKWLLNPNKDKIDYKLFYEISLGLLLLSIIFIYWNLKLQKANEIIEQEKNKLNEILSKLPTPILIVENQTKKILFANYYSSILYKAKQEELLGKSIDILYTQEDQREKILKAMNKDGSLINFESSFKLLDGVKINALLSYIPLKYEEKDCRLGVITDISELKKIQEELKDLNENLEERIESAINKNKEQQMFLFQQSRLAQMGEMISMIAHQWRQPLNILSLIIQTLQFSQEKKELANINFDDLTNDATKQIKQMSQTIEDFMNFFKPQKKIEIFDANMQVEKSLKLLDKLLLNKSIQTEVSLIKDTKILGYPNEFGQVLINILANAKDAICEKNIRNGKIKIESFMEDSFLIIKIKDNAGGIKEDLLDKIFNPYFSTKSEKNGTGLGLYMSKLIVEEHMHGKIDVKNEENGACFRIELKIQKELD